MMALTEQDEKAVDTAMDAFYASLAATYKATTGDMPAQDVAEFHVAARRAAWIWILNNDPAPR